MSASTITFAKSLEPEDRIRADFYAIFARLFFSPPDADLLRVIGSAPLLDAEADAADLAISWAKLSAAARVMDPDAAQDEYEALFGGVGHSAVSLFGSFYVGGSTTGAGAPFLVDLRTALMELGLGLQQGQNVPEDHVAPVFETMRLLIEGGPGVEPRSIAEQKAFFTAFVAPWCAKCCTAIAQNSVANFYKVVAQSTNAFVAIEDESFAIS
ncbi:MAG: molecular chaperone TorD family protein [Betaproteobacteria bacterium]